MLECVQGRPVELSLCKRWSQVSLIRLTTVTRTETETLGNPVTLDSSCSLVEVDACQVMVCRCACCAAMAHGFQAGASWEQRVYTCFLEQRVSSQ